MILDSQTDSPFIGESCDFPGKFCDPYLDVSQRFDPRKLVAKNHVLSTIGGTPLVRLARIMSRRFRLYAKLEGFNPGGSIKDRTALNILQGAIDAGDLRPGMTVIESSSGNMGIGLAQACAYLGLRFVCVVDPKTTIQNRDIIHAFGAEIDLVTEPDPESGEFLPARIARVQDLVRAHEDSFWPNQYANLNNPRAHQLTMFEILEALDWRLDFLFCAVSTCGTLRGCNEFLRDRDMKTTVVGVDAVGSVIFGGKPARRLIPGHGAAVQPALKAPSMADDYALVSDLDCVVGCRRLVNREAILAGGSSGAVISAVEQFQHKIPDDAVCAVIFPDRGERYLDTIYSDEWISKHFGDVAHLWETDVKASYALQ